jgi:hypothetical protein
VATALLYRRTKTSLVGLVSQISTVWANGNWVGGDGKISKRNQNVAMAFGLGERFGPKSKWAAEIRFGIWVQNKGLNFLNQTLLKKYQKRLK